MRSVGLTALALLVLATSMSVPSVSQGPPFSAASAPWWGEGDPEDATVGWHFRVPVVVTNPYGYALENAAAQVEMDLGRRLVDAGWNGRSLGTTAFPTSFTLDEDSVRVIGYAPGFADIESHAPVPSRFYPGRISVAAEAPYDAARNPSGTVVFVVDGSLAPGSSRSYMVTFTSEQQGSRAREDAPGLVSGWASQGWGTTAYGFEQGAQGRANRIDIVAREGGTRATVYTFKGGRPVVADLADVGNPLFLGAGDGVSVSLPSQSFFKVAANRPIFVTSRGALEGGADDSYGGGAFIPSTSGHFVGHDFYVPQYAQHAILSTARAGSARVDTPQGQLALSTARPFAVVDLQPENVDFEVFERIRVQAGGVPITVQLGGPSTGTHAVPARTGGIGGTDHLVVAAPGSVLRLRPLEPATVRIIDAGRPGNQLHPFGPVDATGPALLAPYPPTINVVANESWPRDAPVRVLSTSEGESESESDGRPGRIAVSVGQGSPAGPFYLDESLRTVTRGPLAVMGAYNGTRVTIVEQLPGSLKTTSETVNRDGVILFEPDPTNSNLEALVHVTKPAAVVPTNARETYARALPAFGSLPTVQVGALEFRGSLVRLGVEGAVGGQAVRTIGPGQSASFEVTVENAGRWPGGEQLLEEVLLSCAEAPIGWTVAGCGETLPLAPGQSRRARIDITPGDVAPGSRLLLKVTAHGARWNTTDEGQLALLVREAFGVEAWFFAEGGPKDLVDAPFLVDKGEDITVPFVVKNTGTVRDAYELRLFPPQSGWTLETLSGGDPAKTVTLEPGEAVALAFEARADPQEASPATPLNLEIVSLSNELAFDTLRGDLQLLTILDVMLRAPRPVALLDPGRLHAFPVDIVNRGESVVTVALNASGALPGGWTLAVPLPEVSVFPGQTTHLNVTLNTPLDAGAGDRGTIRLVASAARNPGEKPTQAVVVLTGLVRHVHDLGFPTEPVAVRPGTATELSLPLVNNGNGDEDVFVLGLTPAWPFRAPERLIIPPGETGVLVVTLDMPADEQHGPANVTIHLSLARQTQENVTLPLRVLPTPRIEIVIADPKPLLPGRGTRLEAELSSTGNVPVAGDLRVLLAQGWEATVDPPLVDLAPGRTLDAVFTITPPPDLPDGTASLVFAVDPGSGERVETAPRSFAVGRPDLRVSPGSVDVSDLAGGGLLVTARVFNNGTVEARDVEVALVRDERVLAKADVSRIGVGASVLVSLAAEGTDSAEGVRLVVDPKGNLPDPTPEDNAVLLEGGGIPLPLWSLALALALALALGRRRAP